MWRSIIEYSNSFQEYTNLTLMMTNYNMANFSPPLHNWTPHSRKNKYLIALSKYIENKLSMFFTLVHTCLDSCALRMLHRVQYSWVKNSCVAQSFFLFSFLAKSRAKRQHGFFFFFFSNGIFCQNKFPLFREKIRLKQCFYRETI